MMKYLIIGAGGTGGNIGGFLQAAKKDVTFIARGEHLKAMKERGLKIHSDYKGEMVLHNVKAYDMQQYEEKVDVIFLCVKGYSIQESIPFIKKVSHKETLVIPILNIFGTGDELGAELEGIKVLDGCIYIVGFISGPGEIVQRGDIFKVVFGARKEQPIEKERLEIIKKDLEDSEIKVKISEDIKRDTFEKFSFISSYATNGAYYNVMAKGMQEEGECRDTFIALVKESAALAEAMGITFNKDIVSKNIRLIDQLTPETTASMQKDILAGKEAEIEGIVFDPIRLAQRYGVGVPVHYKIAKHFGFED